MSGGDWKPPVQTGNVHALPKTRTIKPLPGQLGLFDGASKVVVSKRAGGRKKQ